MSAYGPFMDEDRWQLYALRKVGNVQAKIEQALEVRQGTVSR
ncbi:MAG: hypothetical protein U0236_14420 [Nitrospira sp.]